MTFSAPGYWLSRIVFTRALALIYIVAFVAALRQFRGLTGERGILPVPRYVEATGFRRAPSLFQHHYSDRFFAGCCTAGLVLGIAALVGAVDVLPVWGYMAAWGAMWALYLSIVNVGQVWYSFGWESLLLEAGFLAAFLGPAATAPPRPVLWMLRWLLFRLEFGAGLIKVRGDRCWRDLTCLHYHHETQPMPNPMSWWFHRLPGWMHCAEVLANHATQLVVIFGIFAPQPFATMAAGAIVITQVWLMLSGNFAWLNALTLTLALSVADGRLLHDVLPIAAPRFQAEPVWYEAIVAALIALVAVLSWWPARNLVSRRQKMNASFNRLHLVNTYGAFGSVTRVRDEVVIEGTDDPEPGPETVWREYEFKGKPGDPRRRPPQVAPYHLRLDWLMWFAGISPSYAEDWFVPFVVALLEGNQAVLGLLRTTPFPSRPPLHVRASIYRYRFTTSEERRATGAWWRRSELGPFLRPLSLRRRPADR